MLHLLDEIAAAEADHPGQTVAGDIGFDVGGIDDLTLAGDQALIEALLYYLLEDLAEDVLAQAHGAEVADSGVVGYLLVHCQAEEELVGQVYAGVFDYLSVGVAVEVLEEAQPEHELRVLGGPAEYRGVSVFDQVMNEGEIDHGVDFAEEVVLRNDAVVEVASVEGGLWRLLTQHGSPPVVDESILADVATDS